MKTIKKQLKRAFTIVELVIVIAVIAVLAAVLIPTFVNVLDSANESVDEQAVANMNKALIADETLHGIPEDPKAAMEIIESAGYNVENYVAQLSTNMLYYDWTENRVLIWSTASNSVTYPSEMVEVYTNASGIAANWYTLSNAYSTVKVSNGNVTIDNTTMTVAEAVAAADEGDTLILKLEDDLTVSSVLSNDNGASITIDLNENELNYTAQKTTNIEGGSTLYIKNGTLSDSGIKNDYSTIYGTLSVYSVAAGSSITLENVEVESKGTVLYPRGDSAQVNVINSNITTEGAYCVSSSADTKDYYGVVMRIENSTLTAKASDYDSCAVMINVEGTLEISDSTIIGQRQGVIVRAGTATITNTTISCTVEESDIASNFYTRTDMTNTQYSNSNRAWHTGNEVAMGAVVVGNDNYDAYFADANVTMTGCTLSYTIIDDVDNVDYSEYAISLFVAANHAGYSTSVTLSEDCTVNNKVVKFDFSTKQSVEPDNSCTCNLTGYSGDIYNYYDSGWKIAS